MSMTFDTIVLPRIDASATATPVRASRKLTLRAHLPLTLVLILQAAVALRLSNAAFLDEATYLYAGHEQIAALLHGRGTEDYASYFSGAPFLYPIMGALADTVGGLAGARLLSLMFMLAATCFVFAATKTLFDRRAANFAAAVFAFSGPVLFMSHFATFDAPAVLMLACALYLAVRSTRRTALILDTAAVSVLAVAFKYAAMVYVFPVIAVAVLAAVPRVRWRAALARGAGLLGISAVLAGTAVLLAGGRVLTGIVSTTTARSMDTVAPSTVARQAAIYVGAAVALACLGAVIYAIKGFPGDDRPRHVRVMLAVTLAGAGFIAALGSARLHTLTSLEKHTGYGLIFATPLAGVALAWLARRSVRGVAAAMSLVALVGGLGVVQANHFFGEWPDARPLARALSTLVTGPGTQILAEENSAPRYYLRDQIARTQWSDTYYFAYTNASGEPLVGEEAYKAAISDRRFTVVVFSYNVTPQLDAKLVPTLVRNGYRETLKVPYRTRFGAGNYSIWTLAAGATR